MQHCVPAFAAYAATADECCGRKKLPFAEYSVVKDQPAGNFPTICLRRLLDRSCYSRSAHTIEADVGG